MTTNIITFPTNRVVKTHKPVFSKYNPFANLFRRLKEQQRLKRKQKIDFLYQQAYQFYYDLLETPHHVSEVDLPPFIYEEQRKSTAAELAHKALLDVIADCRVEICYKKRIEAIKNKTIKG